ncbi:unnamed protein product [Closterium sp. NIES-53]
MLWWRALLAACDATALLQLRAVLLVGRAHLLAGRALHGRGARCCRQECVLLAGWRLPALAFGARLRAQQLLHAHDYWGDLGGRTLLSSPPPPPLRSPQQATGGATWGGAPRIGAAAPGAAAPGAAAPRAAAPGAAAPGAAAPGAAALGVAAPGAAAPGAAAPGPQQPPLAPGPWSSRPWTPSSPPFSPLPPPAAGAAVGGRGSAFPLERMRQWGEGTCSTCPPPPHLSAAGAAVGEGMGVAGVASPGALRAHCSPVRPAALCTRHAQHPPPSPPSPAAGAAVGEGMGVAVMCSSPCSSSSLSPTAAAVAEGGGCVGA